ncbi:hypothetical protein DL89DRAFT_270730 [Linderina pennispora]|uniref:B box-type domain-containing protein n=1 Tax=Linderina pennispora TaxID=61395 RepID=A0A1Y1VWL2_9FUNG|nr:uncharacterized protein DL89DRAFT_270730 [Linderina pennispora]ORX65672.1 hypothetical protein DL89DRAFT_270730 [Linderina pennispora]
MRPFKHSGKQRFRPQVSSANAGSAHSSGTFNGEQVAAGSPQEATVASPASNYTLTDDRAANEPGKRTTLKPITKPTIVPDPTVVTVATAMVGPESTSFSFSPPALSQSPPTQAAPSASSPEIYSPATRASQIAENIGTVMQSDRCSVHPGMRNDYWCESCELAICELCIDTSIDVPTGTAHHSHAITKLAAAYDDTFEAIELMQVKLVNHLKDTRHRNALLDSAVSELADSYSQAQVAMDEQLLRDTERVETAFRDAQSSLEERIAECAAWRDDLDETLKMVQMMVEELSPAQTVAEREQILELLSISEQARPIDWEEPLPKVARIEEEVMPAWHYASVEVPDVMELGRKRGHVRVVSDAISAHGVVWQLEIRRSRSRLGTQCLSVVVNRIDGCENIDGTFTVSVGLAKVSDSDCESESSALSRFRNESCNVWGQSSSSQTFNMCPLEDLKDSDTLTQSGSVSIRFGADRIRVLEEKLRAAENGKGDMEQAALELIRRRRSDIRSWAASPRNPRRSEVKPDQMPIPGFTFGARPSEMPSAVQLPPALLSPISHAAAGSSSNVSTSSEGQAQYQAEASSESTEKSSHQRSFSLTAKLRRQPPAPFPSSGHTRSLTSTPSTQSSESSSLAYASAPSGSASVSVSPNDDKAGVLRRLSGWVKTTEGRFVQHAKRVKKIASGHKGSPGAVDQQNSIDEWTFLDKSYSEALHCEAAEHVADNGSPLAASTPGSAGTKPPPPPPQIPLPPPPFAADFGASDTVDDSGFAFDGAADIEREQMEVDARMESRRQKRAMMGLGGEQEPLSPAALASPLKGSCAAGSPSPSKKSPRQQLDIDSEEVLEERYKSIIQRFDALQLIANTVQNSRTMRRVSSEINIVMEGRRRRLEEARSGGNTTNDPSPRRTEHPLNRATSPDSYTSPELDEGSSSGICANRYYALTKKQNPAQALSRRSISMDPREINYALAGALGGMQAAAGDNPPLPKTDSDSMDLVKDLLSRSFSPPAGEPTLSPSSGTVDMKPASVSLPETTAMDPLLSPEIKGASHNSASLTTSPRQQRARRCSITSVTSSTSSYQQVACSHGPRESSSSESVFQPAASNRNGMPPIDLQHLTPQANKTGGILKAGRSRRSKPTRLHNIASVASSFAVSGGDIIGSPLLKAGRSSTLPVIVDEAKLASTAVTPPSSKSGSMPRHPKSSQSTRKRVRFPDELRLLENIRLINPQVAQLHDERAAAAASARGIEHEDVNSLSPLGISAPREKRMGSPPPPAFDLSMALDADDEDDGLVSRIKHSLRKSVRQSADSLENREHSPSPPRSGSPEKFEVAEAPVDSPTNPATHSFQRQPIPSQLRAPVCFGGTTGDEYSRCLGKVSIDNSPSSLASAFEPCLSPSPPATDSQAATPQSQSVSGHSSRGTSMSSTLSASLAGLGMDQGRASITTTETDGSSVDLPLKKNNQGMHVGPNVPSAQSSPMGSMPLQQGTPSTTTSSMPQGTFSSAYRYTTDMMVFGVEQIPAIARGKNTAMSIFQQGSDTAHQ